MDDWEVRPHLIFPDGVVRALRALKFGQQMFLVNPFDVTLQNVTIRETVMAVVADVLAHDAVIEQNWQIDFPVSVLDNWKAFCGFDSCQLGSEMF